MSEQRDYRDTVFLPKTDFPMKAGLPQKEPGILAAWQDEDLYQQIRDARQGREQFILHDGPPYANGDMHIGHALNHILKDMVVRTQTLLGKDAPYVPGWDCHGLPIEWKVEEQYRKKKLNKDEVPVEEFRAECRAYAQTWVNTQREQLKRLGVGANWDKPYLTMDYAAEGTIVRELLKFAENGLLYRGAKPVMWSPVEKTALAEAEVEYENITSTQIDVAFEITDSPVAELVGAYAVIWTTTPWTIPVNQALAYGPDVEYGLFQHEDGRKFIIALELKGQVASRWLKAGEPLVTFKGADLAGSLARHPMHALGDFYARPRPLLAGSFVTTESGTGLVHMAPDHGEDDFDLCKANGIEPQFAVMADGRYRDDWLWLGAHDERRMSVINPKFNAPEGPVCGDLTAAGALLAASADYAHSYPHSWRSKAKVIFRCTPQWFVPMDKPMTHISPKSADEKSWEDEGGAVDPADEGKAASPTLRETAMKAIEDTRFVPAKGRNRIGSMVEGRPDWVLSRQRAWGVPITLFVDRKTGQYLNDPDVNNRIITAVSAEGVDAWSDARAQDYLGEKYDAADYERIVDILDVWFDSGCTHAFVLESGRWPELVRRDGSTHTADLYLEGSDQHRGWFQSSLLESCGTRGQAPYKAVLTHGFTMDSKGMKMSKSLGNTISPLDLMRDYGADIIRLWALSVDFTEDHRIGKEILAGVADQYRKLRNTFRYMLGALDGFTAEEAVPVAELPELELYMLALLGKLDAQLRQATDDFDFNSYTRALLDFCNEDLSAFFFDIRKDRLYCDAPSSLERRAYRTALDTLFHALIRYAAPVTVFTAEEVWKSRFPDASSVHLLEWPEIAAVEADEARWARLRDIRANVNEAIEPLRREKLVKSSLEATVVVQTNDVGMATWFETVNDTILEEVLIVSKAVTSFDPEGEVAIYSSVQRSDDHKCGRCWRLLPDVTEDGALCGRCDSAVAEIDG